MRPLCLLALSLAAAIPARAFDCDTSGYEKTVRDCSQGGGNSQSCVERLVPVLIQCQRVLDKCDDTCPDHTTRVKALLEFSNSHADLLQQSLAKYEADHGGRVAPELRRLGLVADSPAGETAAAPAANGGAVRTGSREGRGGDAGNGAGPSAAARIQAAGRALSAGNAALAAKLLDEVLAANPDDAAARALRAQARAALGDRTGALADARRAVALDPQDHESRALAAEIERVDQARGRVGNLRPGFGPDAGAPGGLGDGRGKPVARDSRPAPAAAGPGSATPGAAVAGAAGPAREGFKLSPLLQKALQKMSVGDYTGALVDVSQQIDQDPKDPAAWTLRAELELRLGSHLAAQADATRALDLSPDSPRALRARSYAELQLKLYQQALADASRAVQLDPKSGLGWLYKAMAEDKLGMTEAAERDLKAALELDPTLRGVAEPLLRKYGLAPSAPEARRLQPWMLRGGFVGVAMLLILAGLLGSRKVRTLVRLTPRRADGEPLAGPAPATLRPGDRVGGTYRVVRELGRGGMGVVYEGLDEALQRKVAIKRLNRDAATSAEDVERFLREARLVAALKHPNLAQIYAVVERGEPLLVFEFIDGRTLDEAIALNRALPLPAARRAVAQVAAGLAAAHARGIIHRDLKPGNVMLTPDGQVKVMDFGIAHEAKTAATKLTRTIAAGTPPYMAPEQSLGSVSKSSDLYALGVMTYELVTGRRPFEGPDFLEAKLEARYAPATGANPALPQGLDAFFRSALNPDPTKRPPDAAAFAAAFERACEPTPRRATTA